MKRKWFLNLMVLLILLQINTSSMSAIPNLQVKMINVESDCIADLPPVINLNIEQYCIRLDGIAIRKNSVAETLTESSLIAKDG